MNDFQTNVKAEQRQIKAMSAVVWPEGTTRPQSSSYSISTRHIIGWLLVLAP